MLSAGPQARLKAGAQRTLEAVACTPLFGSCLCLLRFHHYFHIETMVALYTETTKVFDEIEAIRNKILHVPDVCNEGFAVGMDMVAFKIYL